MISPFLNTSDVALYLRFVRPDGSLNHQAALKWINRHVPARKVVKRGRAILIHRDDLDNALTRRTA